MRRGSIVDDDGVSNSRALRELVSHGARHAQVGIGESSERALELARGSNGGVRRPGLQGQPGPAEVVPVDDQLRAAQPRREPRDGERRDRGWILHEDPVGPARREQQCPAELCEL